MKQNETNVTSNKIEIYRNAEHHGIEIYGNGQLTTAQVDALEIDGFKWHKVKQCYYATANKERYNLIHRLFGNDVHIGCNDDLTDNRKLELMKKIYGLLMKTAETVQDSQNTELKERVNLCIADVKQELNKLEKAVNTTPKMPF